jgi:hypothetical protein
LFLMRGDTFHLLSFLGTPCFSYGEERKQPAGWNILQFDKLAPYMV